MENSYSSLKWFFLRQLFYPSPKNILDLLQALDAANQLEVIPSVWEGWWEPRGYVGRCWDISWQQCTVGGAGGTWWCSESCSRMLWQEGCYSWVQWGGDCDRENLCCQFCPVRERWWLCVFKCQQELEVIVLGNAVLTREQQLKQLPRFDSCKFFACSLLFMLGRRECKYGL